MKFKHSVIINQEINKTVNLFTNPDNFKHFQEGFIAMEHISGIPGEKGAKSKLVYKRLELIETIYTNNLPDEFYALYEHKSTVNTMHVSFKELGKNITEYTSEIEYTEFNGFMINVMVKVFPSLFKKQVLKWMLLFKDFAEKN